MQISTRTADHRFRAVLGPTNTGKTHLAMERMLAHQTGMIGFPLRLLARENYDRAIQKVGRGAVALFTGEERILPPNPRYFICTVEAMPVSRQVDFLAVDEIQMCADPERGHVFTDRLLHARGRHETMVMGAETIRPVIRELVRDAEFDTRTRLSTLSYAGPKRLQRLAPRSAIVAFSAQEVYAIAELIRRQKGGAAVVMGALSPRTRNAQVSMFQNGEVDYLIATDAIGMGLNLEVNHVAFAGLHKFDGQYNRDLMPAEVGQIAGRAGRHMNDGTFGTTGNLGALDPELIEQVEEHTFDPLKRVFWRNSKLEFRSIKALQNSLRRRTDDPVLIRAREAVDELMLEALAKDDEIQRLATSIDQLELLWQVCRIPDFRNVHSDAHPRLLAQIYKYLAKDPHKLPYDWVAEHVSRLERFDGDIEQLSAQLASIRVWTFISHHPVWLHDPTHWQERTRAIEDKLSDVLHERLIQRFVDRRTSVLLKSLKDKSQLMSSITEDGQVLVEDQYVGRLEGLTFRADETDAPFEAKAIAAAARRVLADEITRRIGVLDSEEGDADLAVTDALEVTWKGAAVAKLVKGETALGPDIKVLDNEYFDGPLRERVRSKVKSWLDAHIEKRLAMLTRLRDAELTGAARGLLFQLCEGLGCVPRADLDDLVKDLSDDDRKAVAKMGVRLGVQTVHVLDALKPDPVALRAVLWSLVRGLDAVPELPPAGRTSVPNNRDMTKSFYLAAGYLPVGPLAARVDMLERFAALLRQKARDNDGKVTPEPDLLSLLGCTVEQAEGVFEVLGFRAIEVTVEPEEVTEGEAAAEAAGEGEAEAKPEPKTIKYFVRKDRRPRHNGGNRSRGPRRDGQGKGPRPQKSDAPKPAAEQPAGDAVAADGEAAPAVENATAPESVSSDKPKAAKPGKSNKQRRKDKGKGPQGGGGSKGPRKSREPQYDEDSPFAKLKVLLKQAS